MLKGLNIQEQNNKRQDLKQSPFCKWVYLDRKVFEIKGS